MNEGQYYHHRLRGTQWREYCTIFPGIPGFITFQTQTFKFTSTDCFLLNQANIHSLRRHLDGEYVSAIYFAGKLLEDSMNPKVDDVEFIGERQRSLEQISMKDLVSYLKPVETTNEIMYQKGTYPDWPKTKVLADRFRLAD
jgi:hypothetical protein